VNAAQSGSTDCLATDHPPEIGDVPGQQISMMSCQDAISIGDGRELFVIETNMDLTIFRTGLCVEAKDGLVNSGNILLTENCV